MDVVETVDDTVMTDTGRDVVRVLLTEVVTSLKVVLLVSVFVLVELTG
jgi:hypothetical protein